MSLRSRSALIVALCSLVFQTAVADADPQQATTRIISAHGHVTATVIHQSAEHGLFALTCRHSLEKGAWSWELPQGLRAGRWHVIGQSEDLALLWDAKPGLLPATAPVADEDVEDGDICLSVGYDHEIAPNSFSDQGGNVKRAWRSAIRKVGTLTRGVEGWCGSSETVTVRNGGPGRSGGGLFNDRGQLVGVCSYRGAQGCTFVALDNVVRFLNRCHAKGWAKWWNPRDPQPTRRAQIRWYIAQGDQARMSQQFETAQKHYTEALRLDPACTAALYGRGVIRRQEGRLEEALADFDRVLNMNPRHANACNSRANVLASQGERKLALAGYDLAIRLQPSFAQAWYNRGILREKLQQYAEAQADLEKAARLAPGEARPAMRLARILTDCPDASLRNPARALEWAQYACQATGHANRQALEALLLAANAADDEALASQARELLSALNGTNASHNLSLASAE